MSTLCINPKVSILVFIYFVGYGFNGSWIFRNFVILFWSAWFIWCLLGLPVIPGAAASEASSGQWSRCVKVVERWTGVVGSPTSAFQNTWVSLEIPRSAVIMRLPRLARLAITNFLWFHLATLESYIVREFQGQRAFLSLFLGLGYFLLFYLSTSISLDTKITFWACLKTKSFSGSAHPLWICPFFLFHLPALLSMETTGFPHLNKHCGCSFSEILSLVMLLFCEKWESQAHWRRVVTLVTWF